MTGRTFCHFTIARTTPLVIPDTEADPVYREVPTVQSLGVKAYVGVPIVVRIVFTRVVLRPEARPPQREMDARLHWELNDPLAPASRLLFNSSSTGLGPNHTENRVSARSLPSTRTSEPSGPRMLVPAPGP